MAFKSATLAMHLDGDRLAYFSLDEEGRRKGKILHWDIRKPSQLPRGIFFRYKNQITRTFLRMGKNTDDFPTARDAVLRALRRAGAQFRCVSTEPNKRTDIAWKAEGKLLVGFQIHKDAIDSKRLATLLESKTVFRLVIVVGANGYFRVEPQATRPDSRTKK